MANAVVGALRVVLGADTAALEKGMKSAQSDLHAFGASAAKAGAVIAGALAGALGGIGVSVRNAITEADKLGKMGQKFGVAVDELSALKHAADLSDVSVESLGKGLGKLSKTMVEAAAKPTSEAANAFKALGISVTNTDGSLKSSSQMMSDVAGKFEGIKDGAGKTAVAMALFGRSGADLIPLLNSGKAGLEEMKDEAAQLGIVIDAQTAKSAEAFNDNLTRLGKVKDGIILQITARMLPALQTLSQRMIDAAKSGGVVETMSSVLVKSFEVVARGAMLVSDNIGLIVRIGAGFVAGSLAAAAISTGVAFVKFATAIRAAGIVMAAFAAVKSLSLRGLLIVGGILAAVTGQFDGFTTKLKEIADKVTTLLPEGAAAGLKSFLQGMGLDLKALEADLTKFATAASGAATKGLKNINLAAMGGKNALDQFLASSAKSTAGLLAEAQTVGLATGEKEKLKTVMQAYAIAAQNGITVTPLLAAAINQAGNEAAAAALKMQGMNLIAQSAPVWQQYQMEMANVTAAMQAANASAEQLAAGQEMVAARFGMTWQTASAQVTDSLQSVAGSLAGMNQSWARAVKAGQAIAAAQALIATMAGAADALKMGFPQNLAFSAKVLAQGMALVGAIKGVATPGGFSTGGAIRVPGGVGGGDSVRAMIDLMPGEQLDIWRPDQGGGDPRRNGNSGGQPVNITLNGENYSRSQIEKLIQGINEALRDGHHIKLNPAYVG